MHRSTWDDDSVLLAVFQIGTPGQSPLMYADDYKLWEYFLYIRCCKHFKFISQA